MPTEVIMPKVDMDMASGKIMSWHVAEGEAVGKGDPLFDIETDKAAMEVEAPAAGILHHMAPEGTEIPIGTPCAWLYAEGEEVGDQPAPFAAMDIGAVEAEVSSASNDGDAVEAEPASTGKTRATPRARSLAAKADVDIAGIDGSGPHGRVQADDVREALNTNTATTAPASFQPETGDLAVTRTRGGEGTPVVLIHGFASEASSWAPIQEHLRHRPVIHIELPSHGKSPRLKIDSFADLAKEVRRAFDGLDLETAHVVGHSLGGALSLALADTRPKNIAALTLISPAGLGPEVNGEALTGICNAGRPESLGPWLRTLVANEDIITDSYVRVAMATRTDPEMRAAQSALANVLFPDGVQAMDLRAALERIDMQARIIWGKRDRIIPWKHALRAPGNVALHLFEEIGHLPVVECADEVGEIIRSCV